MASMNIKRGDTVEITVGGVENVGKRGKVIAAYPEEHKIVVEGLNMVVKHRKPRNAQEQGGKVERPRAIDVSNVMLVCPKCNQTTRVGHVLGENGKYVRCCKREGCGAVIDVKAKKTAAKASGRRSSAKKAAKTEE